MGCEARFSTLEKLVTDKLNSSEISSYVTDDHDAIRRAINFVADAHAALRKELRRVE